MWESSSAWLLVFVRQWCFVYAGCCDTGLFSFVTVRLLLLVCDRWHVRWLVYVLVSYGVGLFAVVCLGVCFSLLVGQSMLVCLFWSVTVLVWDGLSRSWSVCLGLSLRLAVLVCFNVVLYVCVSLSQCCPPVLVWYSVDLLVLDCLDVILSMLVYDSLGQTVGLLHCSCWHLFLAVLLCLYSLFSVRLSKVCQITGPP